MPLARFLQSISGTCRYCGQPTGIFQREHPKCQKTLQAGWQEMVSLVTQAATDHSLEDANGNALAQSCPPSDPNGDQTIEWLKTVIEPGTYNIQEESIGRFGS